jgi:citrate lyase subunit beta/citryl-CoA lyase
MLSTPPLDCIPYLPAIAPCEHIAGNEKFILKAFSLQTQHRAANGRSHVDVTLDLEDGAPVGNEEALRHLFVTLLLSPENKVKQCGVRTHSVDSAHFERDLEVILGAAGHCVRYITIPKVKNAREVRWCSGLIRHYLKKAGHTHTIPLHLLIETSDALRHLDTLAAFSEVETLDFGLMDFISQLGGGVPAECMRSPGQFNNQLVCAAKSAIALAALGNNSIPSHNVTVNVRDPGQAFSDAHKARTEFGFLRMWSIHPDQIEPIIRAMTPSAEELSVAKEILTLAASANWGPVEHNGRLHDRASFRYYWGVVARAGEGT